MTCNQSHQLDLGWSSDHHYLPGQEREPWCRGEGQDSLGGLSSPRHVGPETTCWQELVIGEGRQDGAGARESRGSW